MSIFFPNHEDLKRAEEKWREEMMLKLMTKKYQTVEDMEVPMEEVSQSQNQESDKTQAADLLRGAEHTGQEAGENAGIDVGFDGGIDGGMDGGFDGGTDGGMDGGMDGGCM